jgi:hypothetical protein
MGSKPTKAVPPYVPPSRKFDLTDLTDLTDTTVQSIIDPSSSKSMDFEDVEPNQDETHGDKIEMDNSDIRDLHDKLTQLDAEIQKGNDTISRLNHTVEILTNQVILLSETIKRSDHLAQAPEPDRASASASASASESIQTQLYGLERTFSNSAASFDKGIRTLHYIVNTLIQNEGILVKYMDKLVSIITIYEQDHKGNDDDSSEDDSSDKEDDESDE